MRNLILNRGLPTLLLLMAVAVILILSGATAVGFPFGLVVAGAAGIVLLSTLAHDVTNSDDRDQTHRRHVYRAPNARGF